MAYPTPIVEIAFTDGPYVVSPTWTDVTGYVRDMQISRGVNDDWQLVADGSATVTLSNRDRRFDPFNASGPYYGNLLPRRQIRIRATYSGTTYDVFRGFISGWPPEWTDAGYDSTVTLSCFDALQLLGSSSLPNSWADPYIATLGPRHWYKMDDPMPSYQSTATIKDYGSVAGNLTTNAYTFSSNALAEGLNQQSIGSVAFVNGAQGIGTDILNSSNTTSDVTLAYWTKTEVADLNAGQAYITTAGFQSVELKQVTRASSADYGKVYATITTASNQTVWKSNSAYEPGNVYHLAFTYSRGSATGVIYVNGIADTASPSTTAGGIAVPTTERISLAYGSFQQVLIFDRVITQTELRTIVSLSEAQALETTSARVNRIIGETPFSSSLVSTPASPASTVLTISPGAVTASSELGNVSSSEYAPLFVNKAGTLTLYNQSQIRSQTKSVVSQATYGSGGLPIGTEIQLQYDGDSMRNVANVEMAQNGVLIDTNSTSVNTYGEAEEFITTQVSTVQDAQDIGDIVSGWGGQVYAKASPTQVVLSPTENWATTLGLELWDRFTLVVQPRTGSAITTPMLTSRISHSVTPERWNTTLEGSARWAAVFILNQSRLGGTDLLG